MARETESRREITRRFQTREGRPRAVTRRMYDVAYHPASIRLRGRTRRDSWPVNAAYLGGTDIPRFHGNVSRIGILSADTGKSGLRARPPSSSLLGFCETSLPLKSRSITSLHLQFNELINCAIYMGRFIGSTTPGRPVETFVAI